MSEHIYSPKIAQLMQALRVLPGVGAKTAQRMALHLLTQPPAKSHLLADAISDALMAVQSCQRCHILTEDLICQICSNTKRDHSMLCIVESPSDVIAIEQSSSYRGVYFVLKGHLSPIDGVGPEDIGVDKLIQRCQTSEIRELILATNSTVEGEATAHYIVDALKPLPIATSRIAHGIPLGGELEYIDAGTIARAIQHRSNVA